MLGLLIFKISSLNLNSLKNKSEELACHTAGSSGNRAGIQSPTSTGPELSAEVSSKLQLHCHLPPRSAFSYSCITALVALELADTRGKNNSAMPLPFSSQACWWCVGPAEPSFLIESCAYSAGPAGSCLHRVKLHLKLRWVLPSFLLLSAQDVCTYPILSRTGMTEWHGADAEGQYSHLGLVPLPTRYPVVLCPAQI